jgi:UDP-N-acetylmuramate: L-alanyl-gamma-D-glutamyl-meso-diaminopimelate ligase
VEVAAGAAQARVVSFGATRAAHWSLGALRDVDGQTSVPIFDGAREIGELRIGPPGRMNALNALGAYVLARTLGLGHDAIAAGLASFSGIARRQEVVGDFGGITVVDDFAHHPTAVAATLQAIRQRYPDRRMWALFEPRSNSSRRRVFQHDYVEALAAADRIVVAGVIRKASDVVQAEDLFSPAQLVGDLQRRGHTAWALDDSPAIAALVAREGLSGDVVVMMSNGDFGGLRPQLTAALAAPNPCR